MKRSLAEALVQIRPLVEALLALHEVPSDEVEKILEPLISKLCFQHAGVADPGAWFISSLRRVLRQTYGRSAPARN